MVRCRLCLGLAIFSWSTQFAAATSITSIPSPTPPPSLRYDPRIVGAVAHQVVPQHSDIAILERRRPNPEPRPTPAPIPFPVPAPAPAQFWAGWPKETYTVIQTVTQTEPGVVGGGGVGGGAGESNNGNPTTVTETAEATTTLYDSNLSASGTLTVTSIVTVGPGGVIITVTDTDTDTQTESLSGTLTRTRTATLETKLPQETQWTPADIPRFAECLPGDEDYKEPGVLTLTSEQKPTLIALAIMFVVILIGWNFVVIRYVFYPLKVSYQIISTSI